MALTHDPFNGHVVAAHGRRGGLVKVLWSDDDGMYLLTKRLERGRFIWPQPPARGLDHCRVARQHKFVSSNK
jgi:transposase